MTRDGIDSLQAEYQDADEPEKSKDEPEHAAIVEGIPVEASFDEPSTEPDPDIADGQPIPHMAGYRDEGEANYDPEVPSQLDAEPPMDSNASPTLLEFRMLQHQTNNLANQVLALAERVKAMEDRFR